MATKDRTALKDEFKNGNLATGERFADLIDSVKPVQEPVADPAASGTSLSFIDSISQDADGKITPTKKTLDLANAHELNPFKGWYKTGDTLPTTGFDGAYLYFKDNSELTGQTTIYRWNGTTYADTGTVVDTSNVQTFETGQAVNGTSIKDLDGNNDPNAAGVLSAETGLLIGAKVEGVTAEKVLFDGTGGTVTAGKKISNEGVISDSANESIIAINVQGCKKVSFYGYRASAAHTYGYAVYSSASVFDASTLLLSFGYDSNGSSGNYYRMYDVLLPENAVTLVCMYNKANFGGLATNFHGVKYRGETVADMVEAADVKLGRVDYVEEPYYTQSYKIVSGVRLTNAGELVSSTQPYIYVEFGTDGCDSIRFLGICLRSGLLTYGYTAKYYAFGHYENGAWVTDLVERYKFDLTNDTQDNTVMEYIHEVPAQSTHARLLCGYPDTFGEEDFYCYLCKGERLTSLMGDVRQTGECRVLTQMSVPTYGNEMGSAIVGYLSNIGVVNSSSSGTGRVFYIKVTRGERLLLVVEPSENWTNQNNNAVFGYLNKVPQIGDGDNLSCVVSGIVATLTSATGDDHQPATLRMQWVSPDDGYLCYYYKADDATVKIYKDAVEPRRDEALYDTYVEEDVQQKSEPTTTGSNVCEKWYDIKPGVAYKVIYRQIVSQNYNSWSQYDGAGNEIATSNDSGASVAAEHVMEDIAILPNARRLAMRFTALSAMNVGTNDVGMAALMKPLADDGTMPKNDMVYFVSRVKDPMNNNENGAAGTATTSWMWSAWGVKFPEGHKLVGKQTPLVGHFHGTGGYVTSECLSYVYRYGTYMHELLLDAGIAVFDVNGRGVSFCSDGYTGSGVALGERSRHWGSPIAVATAKKAYEVLTERFNCRKGMVVGCTSMGGALVESYANAYPQDLVAAYMCAPALLGLQVRTADYLAGQDDGLAWGATGDHQGDPYLMLGYCQALDITEEVVVDGVGHLVRRAARDISMDDFLDTSTRKLFIPFPKELVIWQGSEDTNVTPERRIGYVRAMRNAGSNVKIRICEGYAHPLMDFYPEVVEYVKSKLVI